ncbi:coiled-coil domain-containing protein [Polaribacter porphyrae]|uniref:Uncharacterized protein n=1 Tax=Polaribacter porphyrae TaxID=1137780 RepID=A0A2S7WQA8_9FLAO|nr:hypothetical protein [Polaribacter porphyrae]PQJ79773.1 hypothetical protein BTO18_11565 [Polaribacter porphyrae]
MKTMKMTNVKLLATVLLSASILTSCKNDKKQIADNSSDIEVVNENSATENTKSTKKYDERIKKRTYKMKDGKYISYNLNQRGIAGFEEWKDFTVINAELTNLNLSKSIDTKNDSETTSEKRIRNLNYRIANLKNTIPTWLRTEEVLEDVADVQKEYLELISESNSSEKEMKENLEELNEKFDDLREELDETINRYIKIHEDAIEEFNEELDDGDIEDAIEEYNEEIKELDKIVKKNNS